MANDLPLDQLLRALRQNTMIRIFEEFEQTYPDAHLKDLVVEAAGSGRQIVVRGRPIINFGSDSFLGLDRDCRVIESIRRGLERWGSHNGASAPLLACNRTSMPRRSWRLGWGPSRP